MHHVTLYLASACRSWLCLRAVRVKSGRMASRLVSRAQWAVMRSGVTMATWSTAEGSPCWESEKITESLVSVSLWPVKQINTQLIETPCPWFTRCVNSVSEGLEGSVTEGKYQRTMFCSLNFKPETSLYRHK